MRKPSLIKQTTCVLLAVSILWAGCASTTMIQSTPAGAKVYINGEPVGTTPYVYTDTKIVGTTTMLKLKKEGYDPLNTSFVRDEEVDVGAIICGFICFFPFLWTMKYKPTHTYELMQNAGSEQPIINAIPRTKADRLRELKQLYEEKLISQEDYEKGKTKILEEVEK
ncbi:MAG TPA: PEGA domain-containing protein [Bacteroidia bacterium]